MPPENLLYCDFSKGSKTETLFSGHTQKDENKFRVAILPYLFKPLIPVRCDYKQKRGEKLRRYSIAHSAIPGIYFLSKSHNGFQESMILSSPLSTKHVPLWFTIYCMTC